MFIKYKNPNIGLLLIRVGLATVFIVNGIAKLSNIDGTVAFFGSLGLGSFFAYLVAIVELLAGISMLIGFWVGISGIALAIIMIVAIFTVKLKIGFFGGGYQLDLSLLLSALGIAFAGPGKYAIDKCSCLSCVCKTKQNDAGPQKEIENQL